MRLRFALKTDKDSIICFLFALIPILNGYSSGIPSFSLGMLFFSLMTLYALIYVIFTRKVGAQNVSYSPLIVAFVLLFMTMIVFVNNKTTISISAVLLAWAKRVIWGVSIVCLPYILRFERVISIMKKVAIVSTIYLIIQNLSFYILKIQLPNVFQIGFIKANYDYYVGDVSFIGTALYRPGSFFSEPAFYGYYVNLVIILLLFCNLNQDLHYKVPVFLSFGILLSTSSGGMYILVLIWLIFFLFHFEKNKTGTHIIVILLIVLGLFFIFSLIGNNSDLFSNWGTFGVALNKAIRKINTFSSNARLGGSFEKLELLSGSVLFFGMGIGLTETFLSSFSSGYVNGIVELLIQSGVLGALVFFIFCISLFIKSKDRFIRVLMIVFVLDGFYSGIYFSMYGMIYLCIINCRRRFLFNDGGKG